MAKSPSPKLLPQGFECSDDFSHRQIRQIVRETRAPVTAHSKAVIGGKSRWHHETPPRPANGPGAYSILVESDSKCRHSTTEVQHVRSKSYPRKSCSCPHSAQEPPT